MSSVLRYPGCVTSHELTQKLSNTPEHLVDRWGRDTFRHLTQLFYGPDAAKAGVSLVLTHYLHTEPQPPPSWYKEVFNFQEMDASHKVLLPRQYVQAYSFNNVTCEGRYYLQYLTDGIKQKGGSFRQLRLESLQQLFDGGGNSSDSSGGCSSSDSGSSSFEAVVDCCGLGASQLLGDKEVYPIRGQIMRVRAPWVTQCYMAGEFYIIPNRNFVVLGGTGQIGNWSREYSLEDKARMWAGCCELVPSLAHAEILEDWVGLRPGRSSLRLEVEEVEVEDHASSRRVPVVHNYGHGGSGLTLAWGCAGDVVQLLKQALG